MIEIQLDGKNVSVPEGSMVMHAADAAGTYVPHFCYHKKLSIAANCRMCLVDVEKAPKPMPACATPVTQGMVVRTKSEKAVKAQQSVMEFLLINHPLDCPICDQGGECQLQDLAVGYGGSASRYAEEKRVVLHKDVGPLISMEEMSRCIHCTRCVRFGQEVAGVMELGMIHRGEHSEITTVAGETVDSELSGNMIDLCPVGALTSKPFRYSARTWELSRRKSISPHDSLGANLVVQVKADKVLRVVPLENEAVNECWIADRDRFSYEALSGPDRLTTPRIKQDGVWQDVDWATALDYITRGLRQISADHGPSSIGALATGYSTVEELHLLAKLVRGLGSDNIDHRLRHHDFSTAAPAGMAIGLGLPVAELSQLESALVVGSFLRKDHPLMAQRLRQVARKGAQIHRIHALDDDALIPMASQALARPSDWPALLGQLVAAIAEKAKVPAPNGDALQVDGPHATSLQRIADSLLNGGRSAILLGNAALHHPAASTLLALSQWIGEHTGASVGYLGESANSVGAQLVRAQPIAGGLDAGQMLSGNQGHPLKAVFLLNVEPGLDVADPPSAHQALAAAEMVVSLSPFANVATEVADVLLPIAPFTETAGSFVNAEGRLQSFHGVVKPLGQTRPAWKVLRVLGISLGLDGFELDTAAAVLADALGDTPADLSERVVKPSVNVPTQGSALAQHAPGTFQRLASVPIYTSDAIVRRAPALQSTADAREPRIAIAASDWTALGLSAASRVRATCASGQSVELAVRQDASLVPGCVHIPAGHPTTAKLGSAFGSVRIEKV